MNINSQILMDTTAARHAPGAHDQAGRQFG